MFVWLLDLIFVQFAWLFLGGWWCTLIIVNVFVYIFIVLFVQTQKIRLKNYFIEQNSINDILLRNRFFFALLFFDLQKKTVFFSISSMNIIIASNCWIINRMVKKWNRSMFIFCSMRKLIKIWKKKQLKNVISSMQAMPHIHEYIDNLKTTESPTVILCIPYR